ncbi:hypothetical protein ACF05W_37645 [Streptomyces lydicus]|uniref:hypothetical protein n=1 Tax=Streptomyces lydicus TaxID=47763 RepID=UPI0036F9DB57
MKPHVPLTKSTPVSPYDQPAWNVSFTSSPGWVKARTCAVWALVAFAAGALLVPVLSGSPGPTVAALQKAGATVSNATVVDRPTSVERDLSEGAVRGYDADLVLSVPNGPGRLPVHGAYTRDRPGEGAAVEVLWSPGAPRLGGVVHARRDLHLFARPHWQAFADPATGRGALFGLVAVLSVGILMGAGLTFTSGTDALEKLAWSPLAQTVRAAMTVAVYLAWLPMLTGHRAPQMVGLLASGSFMLLLLGYCFTSVRAVGKG